jgi:hypothetical protein
LAAPVSSWLTDCIRRHLPAGAVPDPVSVRAVLEGRLTDPRKARGKRHPLPSLVSVLVAGVASAHGGPLAVAQAAAGWDQEVLAAHGCRVSPRTGLRVAPSASMLDRLPKLLDADEFEAALSAAVAAAALDPAIPAAYAAHRADQQRAREQKQKNRKPKPPAAEEFREERGGWFRPHPLHPWLDAAVTGDPGHVPARRAVAVDGKERKLAKAGGKKKVHLLAAVTHVPGLVIAQDKVAKSGKANEISHFKPLLAPLPLDDVLITADAMQANRDNSLFVRAVKHAHYLWPVLGNQPNLNAQLSGLPWETVPVAAATSEISRGRVETRTIRVLPAPEGTGFRRRGPGRAHRALHHVQEQRPVADPGRGRPVHHQPWRARHHSRRPARPRPRALAGGARALATRRDLERRQITHPHRKRPSGLVRPHQPRHHPVPHTRSNQLHRRNPPLRPMALL